MDSRWPPSQAPQRQRRASTRVVTTPAGCAQRSHLRSFAAPLVLALVCLLVYNLNLRQIGAGDTLSARYLPLILLHDGTLELSEQAHLVARGHPLALEAQRPAGAAGKVAYLEPRAYWMMRTREHLLASVYPVVTPLLVAPLYFPAVAWLDAHGWEQPQVDRVAELPLWEGDRHFLPLVFDPARPQFHGVMPYRDGKPVGWSVSLLPGLNPGR